MVDGSMIRRVISRLFYLCAMLLIVLAYSCTSPGKQRKMHDLLLKAERMNSEYEPMDTITFMNDVVQYFMQSGNNEEKVRANYMMGCVYRDRGDSPMTMQFYLEAVSLADTTSKSCDFVQLSKIYAQMALVFGGQSLFDKSLEMWQKAKEMAIKAKDEPLYAEYLSHSGRYFALVGDRSRAISTIKEAQMLFRALGNDEYAASISGELASYYLEQDSLLQAKREIDNYIMNSKLYQQGELHQGCEFFLFYLGQYYEKKEMNDSALYFYRKLAVFDSNIRYKVNGYKGMLSVYAKKQATDSVAKYAELYSNACDIATDQNTVGEVCRVQALYDYSEHQKNATRKAQEASDLWKTLFCVLIFALILGVATWIYVIKQKKKAREYQTYYLLALADYRKAVSDYEQYKKDKSTYENKMCAKVKQLQELLATYQEDFDFDRLTHEQNLHNHQVVSLLHNYALRVKTPTAQDWNALFDISMKMLPEFWSAIRGFEYNLSDQELRMCLLTRLGFVASEIYVLMNISKQRASNMRRKLNKNLFGESSASTFCNNISRIE